MEPFPDNLYPIEFQGAMTTCVAFDSTGLQTPDKILFVRKNQFAEYTELKNNDNLELTNKTELIALGEGEGGYTKFLSVYCSSFFFRLHVK